MQRRGAEGANETEEAYQNRNRVRAGMSAKNLKNQSLRKRGMEGQLSKSLWGEGSDKTESANEGI